MTPEANYKRHGHHGSAERDAKPTRSPEGDDARAEGAVATAHGALAEARLGLPLHYRNLTVFPPYLEANGEQAYDLLGDAISSGVADVTDALVDCGAGVGRRCDAGRTAARDVRALGAALRGAFVLDLGRAPAPFAA